MYCFFKPIKCVIVTAALLVVFITGTHAQLVNIDTLLTRASKLIEKEESNEALATVDSVIVFAKAKGLHGAQAQALGLKGRALFHLNKKTEAVDLYFEGLKVAQAPADNKQIAFLNKEIGYSYYVQGHYKEAKEYYKKELTILRSISVQDSLWKPLINLSVMCQQLAEYDTAMQLLNELGDISFRNINPK